MVQLFRLLIAVLLLCSAPTGAQQSDLGDDSAPPYWEGEGWRVFSHPENDNCTMASVTSEFFGFSYYPKERAYVLALSNRNATSLSEGEKVDLKIYFFQNKNESLDSGWDKQTFTVSRGGGTVGFTSPFLPSPIDKDVAKNDYVALFRDTNEGESVVVAAFPLNGSAKALNHLKECAFLAADLNPDDPFLK